MLTCCVVTSTPQFRNALWTDIGLAGAPFRVVKATQYETAGQRDLLTLAKLPSSHCSLVALGIWLDWSSSSLSLLSSAVSSIMLAFFFSCVEIALKKNAILGIPRIKKKKHACVNGWKCAVNCASKTILEQILTWNCTVTGIALLAYRAPRLRQCFFFYVANTFGAYNTALSTDYWRQITECSALDSLAVELSARFFCSKHSSLSINSCSWNDCSDPVSYI